MADITKGARIPLPEVSESIYILVGDEIPLASRFHSMFVGEQSTKYPPETKARKLHVIATHAGGEVRGYFLIDGNLHLTLPAYPQEWREVDLAVKIAVGAERVHS